MTVKPNRAFMLLTAQLRAYGGKIVPNVVDGHNVTTPSGRTQTFRGTSLDVQPNLNRAKLLDFIRSALATARNPAQLDTSAATGFVQPVVKTRFSLLNPDVNDGEPAGMLGILDGDRDFIIGWVHPDYVDAVIAGIRDSEITNRED